MGRRAARSEWESLPQAEAEELMNSKVVAISVMHTTADRKFAGTDSNFKLWLDPLKSDSVELRFPDKPGIDERERGKTDSYTLFVPGSAKLTVEEIRRGDIRMGVADSSDRSRNAWLPSSFEVALMTVGPIDPVIIDRRWPPDRWFSADELFDPKKSRAEWTISEW